MEKGLQNLDLNLVDEKAEKTVIGQLINQKICRTEGLPLLVEECFSDNDYRKIFRIIKTLYDKNLEVDMVSIEQEKKRQGLKYNFDKFLKATDIATGATHGQLVAYLNELRIRRIGVPIGALITAQFRDLTEDVITTVQKATKELNLLLGSITRSKIMSLSDVYKETATSIQNQDSDILIGQWSIPELNELTIGFTAGDITIIAGRPGMGKTSFALQELRFASKVINTGLISIEMTRKQIMYREISSLMGVSMSKLITKKGLTSTEIAQIKSLEDYFKDLLYVVDNATTLNDVKISIYKLIETFNVKLWAVDYIQLVKHTSVKNNKTADVEEISAEMKYIAKATNTHGIILSQMNREQEKGSTLRRPRLSDLRDSGALEQDASNVIFVHRPEAQGVIEGPNGENLRGKAELVVAKSRNGKIDNVMVNFIGEKYQFTPINPITPEEELPY